MLAASRSRNYVTFGGQVELIVNTSQNASLNFFTTALTGICLPVIISKVNTFNLI